MIDPATAGDFRVERVELPAPGLSADGAPLRFAQLSDLHVRRGGRVHERAASLVAEWEPDFVFVTGDLFSPQPESLAETLRFLGRLRCRRGVFACRGNGELKRGFRLSVLKELVGRAGTELLVNEGRLIETDSGAVLVAAVDDLARGWPDFEAALEAQAEADYTILLSHGPLGARMVEDRDVDLVLSGHTHGGQIRLPGVAPLWLPTMCDRYVAGLYRTAGGYLYVNRGFGVTGLLKARFRCPAEVAFFQVGGLRASRG